MGGLRGGKGPGGKMWLGAVEGYYGPPLAHSDRKALIEWLGTHGYNCYAYAPKDDPRHRQYWREPYPPEQEAEFAELIEMGRRAGVEVGLVLSPGLDWREGDERNLIAKMRNFRDLGCVVLGVGWDDVDPGGAELGEAHGRAVAAAVEGIGDDVKWVTCPTDYSGLEVTPYLEAFSKALRPEVDIMWTGPGIVSPTVSGAQAAHMAEGMGRKLLFAENFPVNDGAMNSVLHLGPYPRRSPDLLDETTGVFCNFMSRPLASRVGLAVAARFWMDPTVDREQAWKECLAEFPGLETLARACRSWVGDAEPDPELVAWAELDREGDRRLRQYLQGDCREGLDRALRAEVEPWLEAWDRESHAMQLALEMLTMSPVVWAPGAFVTAELWKYAKEFAEQVFGIRFAYYPVTAQAYGTTVAAPEALVYGENLTDRLCAKALGMPGR
ncbi:MAG: beta-N-acetylglucosaminidase domain-containing protein [Actinomycetota bacterium]